MKSFCFLLLMLTVMSAAPAEESTEAQPAEAISRPQAPPPVEILTVDAQQNCLIMSERQRPEKKAVRIELKANHYYTVHVGGAAFLSPDIGHDKDPFPGLVVTYCTNEQDGYATRTTVVKPGDELSFTTPNKASEDLFLSAFFIDYWNETPNRGAYELAIGAAPLSVPNQQRMSADADRILNINFGANPDDGVYHGVIGEEGDQWNLIDVGETAKSGLRFADGATSDVEVEVTAHDGEWGINGQGGVYHAYIYDNARNVDLSVTLRYLPPGSYDVIVLAHGDAPDQNARIKIQSGKLVYDGKSTLNDGSWNFRSTRFVDGNQFVKYRIEVLPDHPVVITSQREGSDLSIFNAIQLRRLD